MSAEDTLEEHVAARRQHPVKLLVAVGFGGNVIVDYLGKQCEAELEAYGGQASDWDLEVPEMLGLWVWEGTIYYPPNYDADGDEPDITGAWRRATDEEAERVNAGQRAWLEPPPAEASGS